MLVPSMKYSLRATVSEIENKHALKCSRQSLEKETLNHKQTSDQNGCTIDH